MFSPVFSPNDFDKPSTLQTHAVDQKMIAAIEACSDSGDKVLDWSGLPLYQLSQEGTKQVIAKLKEYDYIADLDWGKNQIVRSEKPAHIRVIQRLNLSQTGLEHIKYHPEFTAMIPHCRSIDLSHNRLNSADPQLIALLFFTLALDKKYLFDINLSHTRFIGLLQNKNLMDLLIRSFQNNRLKLLNLENNQLGQTRNSYSWVSTDPYFNILMQFLNTFNSIDFLHISGNQFSLMQMDHLYSLTKSCHLFELPKVHLLQCKEHEKSFDESEDCRPLTQHEQLEYIRQRLRNRLEHTISYNMNKHEQLDRDDEDDNKDENMPLIAAFNETNTYYSYRESRRIELKKLHYGTFFDPNKICYQLSDCSLHTLEHWSNKIEDTVDDILYSLSDTVNDNLENLSRFFKK